MKGDLMEQKTLKNSILLRIQIVHFGKILFNFEILTLAVMLACVMTFIFPAIYYILLFSISVITLFSVYAWYPEFSSLWAGGETLVEVATYFAQSWQYTVPILLILSVCSILCLCFDRSQKHLARIILSILFAIFAIIVLFLKLVNEGVIV